MARNDQAITSVSAVETVGGIAAGPHAGAVGGVACARFHLPSPTIRRDLAMLEEAGYPLVTERINGHTCWRLMEGFQYSRPPVLAVGINGAHVQPTPHFPSKAPNSIPRSIRPG